MDHRFERNALHRFFIQEHGWCVNGFSLRVKHGMLPQQEGVNKGQQAELDAVMEYLGRHLRVACGA